MKERVSGALSETLSCAPEKADRQTELTAHEGAAPCAQLKLAQVLEPGGLYATNCVTPTTCLRRRAHSIGS